MPAGKHAKATALGVHPFWTKTSTMGRGKLPSADFLSAQNDQKLMNMVNPFAVGSNIHIGPGSNPTPRKDPNIILK